MDLSDPFAVVLSQTEGRVLSVLAGTTKPLSGREVGRIAEVSPHTVWRLLKRLADHGLVREDTAGGSTFVYTLNRDHLAAEPVVTLLRLRSALFEAVKGHVAGWQIQPTHASIFGSAARGDGDTSSDIDIFIVRPVGVGEDGEQWRSQIDDLSNAVLRWTGNHAGVIEIPEGDISRLKKGRPPVLTDLEHDAVVVAGPSPRELFSSRRKR